MWTVRGGMKLIESDEVGWPGELRGDGLLLRPGALLQSLVPTIVACAVDLVDQIDRPPQPQCGQLRTAARTSIDSWAWRSWTRMQDFGQRLTSGYAERLKRRGG